MPSFLNSPNGHVPYLWGRKHDRVLHRHGLGAMAMSPYLCVEEVESGAGYKWPKGLLPGKINTGLTAAMHPQKDGVGLKQLPCKSVGALVGTTPRSLQQHAKEELIAS